MNDFGMMGLSSLAEINYLRLEAMELFERCLTEGRPQLFEGFIEQQISREPPPLELLREVADDLHQRLVSLREYRADVLERAWRTLTVDFSLQDGSRGDSLEEMQKLAHQLRSADTHSHLAPDEVVMLRKMLDISLDTAAQLRDDLQMTERLHGYVSDWVNALNATIARRFWADGRPDKSASEIQ